MAVKVTVTLLTSKAEHVQPFDGDHALDLMATRNPAVAGITAPLQRSAKWRRIARVLRTHNAIAEVAALLRDGLAQPEWAARVDVHRLRTAAGRASACAAPLGQPRPRQRIPG
jgi:hypothetical protein